MKVTRQQVMTVVGLIVSSLLLVLAESCSLEQQAMDESGQKHIVEDSDANHISKEFSDEKGFVANIFCSACHYGFSDEELARTHEKAGVGCERCHGESERHRSDEDNATPPEIMYPRAKINPTCMMCHPRHEIRHEPNHKTLLSGAKTIFDTADDGGDQIYCTGCHATEHRINVRTIRWNKETGELLK